MVNSLYIHIPFCSSICSYCDFCKTLYDNALATKYINELLKDLDEHNKYKTIYIGGGTPSSLSIDLLDKLLKKLSKMHTKYYEFSIELNPNDITLELVLMLKKYGVNRISLGVQTFNNSLLKKLNRSHKYKDIYKSIKLLKENNITNISCDLMYGLPKQTILILKNDLKKLIKLDIPHISTYALQLEPNTLFFKNKVQGLSDDKQAKQYLFINKFLKNKGFIRYEISNFAKPNFESKHNLTYWNDLEYKGIGAGASGFENNIRYTYTKSIQSYIDSRKIIEKEELDNNDLEYEYIILHLRLKDGIDINEFNDKFNINFLNKYKNQINNLINKDLIEIKNGRLYVKEEKMFILNTVLLEFTI